MALSVMKGVAFTEKRLAQWLGEDGCVAVQPKRDEIRCIVTVQPSVDNCILLGPVSYTSASGKPLYNLECFDVMWQQIAGVFGIRVFDCGCLVDDSFDVTKSVLRSSKKKYDLIDRAVFWLYDLPEVPLPFYTAGNVYSPTPVSRLEAMHALEGYFNQVLYAGRVRVPSTIYCNTPDSLHSAYQMYLDIGLEGAMVKRIHHDYRIGRSTDWMKIKPCHEVDVQITGYTEGKGEFEGTIGSVVAVDAEGQTLAFSGFSRDLRDRINADREAFLGDIVEVRYMQRDSQGGYRHPRFYRFHPDKTEL